MVSKALLTSNDQTWSTPQEMYELLNEVFNFNIDLAASKENTKNIKFFSEENSALDNSWKDLIGFCNPPFRLQDKFIEKAVKEFKENNTTSVFLIPSRTGTKRWQKFIFPLADVFFLPGRLKFSSHEASAPFDSAIVIFSKFKYNKEKLSELGAFRKADGE